MYRRSNLTTPHFGNLPGDCVYDNVVAGLAMIGLFDADVSDNIFENHKYEVKFSVGCSRKGLLDIVNTVSAKSQTC